VLVIGLGNRFRGDDAVGLCVADRLRALALPDLVVMTHEGEPVELLDLWHNAQTVVIVDAVESGTPPGTLHRFDVRSAPPSVQAFRYSTHIVSLAEVIELARVLGTLPPHLLVFGIEGANFAAGAELSPLVEKAINGIVDHLLHEINVCDPMERRL
jgi:hydrogenase maturation protease